PSPAPSSTPPSSPRFFLRISSPPACLRRLPWQSCARLPSCQWSSRHFLPLHARCPCLRCRDGSCEPSLRLPCVSPHPWCLKYCTSRSCLAAAAQVPEVSRLRQLRVFASFSPEYRRYTSVGSLRIIARPPVARNHRDVQDAIPAASNLAAERNFQP